MPRSRVPQVPAFIHLALRLCGLAYSIACLYYLIYLATHWGDRHTYYVAIFAVPPAIVVDLVEVCCLLDASFTIKRVHEGWLVFGNIISIGLGTGGCLQVALSDWDLADAPTNYPTPWMDTKDLAFILMIAFPVARLLFSIMECVVRCHRRKRRERREREKRGTALRSVYPPAAEGNAG